MSFSELIVEENIEMDTDREFTPEQVRDATGVSRSQLRYWEHLGIVVPVLYKGAQRTLRRYAPEQVERVRLIRKMLAEGMTLQGALRKMDNAGHRPEAGAVAVPLTPAQT